MSRFLFLSFYILDSYIRELFLLEFVLIFGSFPFMVKNGLTVFHLW
jgi:hypothetical protein